DKYLSELMRLDGWGHALPHCPACGKGGPTFRCRDCNGGAVYCKTCIVARHEENPLHRTYEWRDQSFHKKSLADAGLRIQFGHPKGKRCLTPSRAKESFVCLHVNGIHTVNVDFCGCEFAADAGEPHIQLLRGGWFPATHDRPQTCATLEVLEQFHQLTLQSKVTMYDFYIVLERLTNNAGIKPPDRYHEFIRMCREYWYLMLLKRGGRARAYDWTGAEGTKPGELAVECPACPRPGVNMPADWEDTPECKMFLYTLFLAIDACFRLKRCLVSNELKDPDLGSGQAYMLEDAPYREFLHTVTDQKEMKTCSGLAALDYANTKFSRGYGSTGVVMGVCARHEFVQPNGCGDLQKGERFVNTDYVFGSILRHKHPRIRKLTSYDIACIWSVYIWERLEGLPDLVRAYLTMALMRFVIPKMHIHGHTLLCQIFYSLNLMCGAAETDGEGIERPWSSINGLGASTMRMGPGARHGVLDNQWSYWNWEKLVGLVAMLRRRMDRARIELARQTEAFESFSREQAEHVPAWRTKVETFEAEMAKLGGRAGTSVPNNPYEVKVQGLTEAQVRLQFNKEEQLEAQRGVPSLHDVTPSNFITTGLDIENEQRRVRVQAELKKAHTAGMEIDLTAMRTALSRRIVRFRKLQATYTPAALQALGDMAIPQDAPIEKMPLLLPSGLTAAQRATCKPGLADIEEMMRGAQCREALVKLRMQLHIKSRLLIYKGLHSRAQGSNTRSRTIVARNESKIRLHSEKYQMAWEAIRQLLPDNDASKVGWQRLDAADVRTMEDIEDLRAIGLLRQEDDDASESDGELEDVQPAQAKGKKGRHAERGGTENRRQLSWIWTVAGMGGTDAELEDGKLLSMRIGGKPIDGFVSALRIEWSKAWARTRRWGEEVELLDTEYLRVLDSFQHEANQWDTLASNVPADLLPAEEAQGAVAFAKKQAAMFLDLKARGITTWTEVKLSRGKKRPRAAAAPLGSEMKDNESDDDDESEDDELGGPVSDEEFVMGGEGDEM
ncbi:hypothetical protein C8R47DRAFT_989403, partial [Mycena vitilis]